MGGPGSGRTGNGFNRKTYNEYKKTRQGFRPVYSRHRNQRRQMADFARKWTKRYP